MRYTRETLIPFWSEKNAKIGFYSQWYPSRFYINDVEFCCCEQWMMWSKATLFGDFEIAQQIRQTEDPRQIKALGRKVKGFDAEVWDRHKYGIVLTGNEEKFRQNPELRERLLADKGKYIVEASPYDRVWGVGLAPDDLQVYDSDNWRGENLLGKAIMEVRQDLIEELEI